MAYLRESTSGLASMLHALVAMTVFAETIAVQDYGTGQAQDSLESATVQKLAFKSVHNKSRLNSQFTLQLRNKGGVLKSWTLERPAVCPVNATKAPHMLVASKLAIEEFERQGMIAMAPVTQYCSVEFFNRDLCDAAASRDVNVQFRSVFGGVPLNYELVYSGEGGCTKLGAGAVHTFKKAWLEITDANGKLQLVNLVNNSDSPHWCRCCGSVVVAR